MAKRKAGKSIRATTATAATHVASDWGIPDWLVSTGYEGADRWKFNRWRWEFIRRDKDFRKDSLELLGLMFNCAVPSSCRCGRKKNACLYPGKLERFQKDWRYREPVHPKEQWADVPSGDHERFVMGVIDSPLSAARMSVTTPGMYACLSMRNDGGQASRLSDHEMVVKFDIDQPLSDQLEWAKVLLEEGQKSRHQGKKLKKSPQPRKWRTYLRDLTDSLHQGEC